MRFVAGKSPLKDFKALGSSPIKVIRSRWKRGRGTQLWVVADTLPFAGPSCLMRPEPAVTCSDASVSGGADAVSVEESPRANLKGGLANPKAGLPACLS